MPNAAEIDITVDRRVSFVDPYFFFGADFTGSVFKMQVRQFKDTTGTPLISIVSPSGISLTYGGTATVAAHITAGRLTSAAYSIKNPATGVNYISTDSLALSQIKFGLNAATIAGVPIQTEVGDDVICWYDIIRTPSSGTEEMIMRGKFIVRSGVTIP